MSEYALTEIEQLKIIYQEIVLGYSQSTQGYFVRHLNDLDHIDILRQRIFIYNKYITEGVPSEASQIKSLIERGEWTQQQEDKILELKYIISDNEKNVNLIKEQQWAVKAIIKQKRQELVTLLIERQELIGLTADNASERESYSYLVYISLFKNTECKDPLFTTFDEFSNIEETRAEAYAKEVETLLSRFKENNIRKISTLPFFLNPFSYSKERVHTFIDKPISKLTNYQMLLFSLGTRNINILSQAEGEPPELLDDVQPQKIVDWYDQNYSIILGKQNATK